MADDEKKTKLWDRVFQILAILVIPLLMWGIKLEVNNAVQSERISELQRDVGKNEKMADAINRNTLALAKLEGKLDVVQQSLDTIKTVLRTP